MKGGCGGCGAIIERVNFFSTTATLLHFSFPGPTSVLAPPNNNNNNNNNNNTNNTDYTSDVTGELPNLTFSVSQFNPSRQKYSISDVATFKPRASSLSSNKVVSLSHDSKPRNHLRLSNYYKSGFLATENTAKSSPIAENVKPGQRTEKPETLIGSLNPETVIMGGTVSTVDQSVEKSIDRNGQKDEHFDRKEGTNLHEVGEECEPISELDILSDSIVSSKPPKSDRRNKSLSSRSVNDLNRLSKNRGTGSEKVPTIHRGLTPGARRKDQNQNDKSNRLVSNKYSKSSSPLHSKSFTNDESATSIEVVKSRDDSAIRIYLQTPRSKRRSSPHAERDNRDRSKSQSDLSRKSAGDRSHIKTYAHDRYVSPYEFKNARTATPVNSLANPRESKSREKASKYGSSSVKRENALLSVSKDESIVRSTNNSRLNFSETLELSCGDESKGGSINYSNKPETITNNKKKTREFSSPTVLESTWSDTGEKNGVKKGIFENEEKLEDEYKVSVQGRGVLSNEQDGKRENLWKNSNQLSDVESQINRDNHVSESGTNIQVFSKGTAFHQNNNQQNTQNTETLTASNYTANNNQNSSTIKSKTNNIENSRSENFANKNGGWSATGNDNEDTDKIQIQVPDMNNRMSRSATRNSNKTQSNHAGDRTGNKDFAHKNHLRVPGNGRGGYKVAMQSRSPRSTSRSKTTPASRGSSSQRSYRSTSGTNIKATPTVQPAHLHQKPTSNHQSGNTHNLKAVGPYVKRGKNRASTTVKPVMEQTKKPTSAKKRENRSESGGEVFSDATDREDNADHSEPRPPLPPNARVPPVITDPSVYPYDATEKCIKSLAKHPLDIDFGAWHRNVLPTLPPLVRNPQTGLRYIDRPNQVYMCRGNNTVLVENHFVKHMKWSRTEEKGNNYKFKWMQCVNQLDYDEFRDSEQVVNHIPNIGCLTTKIGLVESLRAYERHLTRADRKPHGNVPDLKMGDFFNETYKLNNKTEFAAFREAYKPGETWICKPNGLNQGIGIFLIRSLQELESKLNEFNSKKASPYKQRSHNYDRMIQRYIERPLLLDNRKIDIRTYMLIASTAPFVVLYHPGYVRLCIDEYKLEDNNLISHLNNQYMQKKDPRYKKMKEDTVWSYEQANNYVNEHFMVAKGIEEDWWYKVFERQVKRIMLHCFQAVKCTLKSRIGTFDLLGFDFMIDENMKVYLIEINVNPALATNCQVLDQVIPPIVMESIDIVMEVWEKARRGLPISPIQSRQNMEVLYNETMHSKYRRSQHSAKLASNFNYSSTTASSNANNSNNSTGNNSKDANLPNQQQPTCSETQLNSDNDRTKSHSPIRDSLNFAG